MLVVKNVFDDDKSYCPGAVFSFVRYDWEKKSNKVGLFGSVFDICF